MTRDSSKERLGEKLLSEALAVLIASTRSKKRRLSLLEIADRVAIAVAALGGYRAVSERIGLSTKMLRQFSYVRRLTKNVQTLFANRILDSVDAATHLAMLTAKDQHIVADALAHGSVDTKDLRGVVEWRRLRPKTPMKVLLKGVIHSKTTQHYVAEFVVRGPGSRRKIMSRLRRYLLPKNVIRLDLQRNRSAG